MHFGKSGYRVYVLFNDISGLNKNAPVMLNGMEVGRVEDMKIAFEPEKTRIRLQMLIRKDIRIPEGPVLSIKTLGIMGEKYVHIWAKKDNGNFINEGACLEGKTPADMDAIFIEAEAMAKAMTELTENLKTLSVSVNESLDSNKEAINRIIANMEGTSKNFEEFSADLKAHPWKLLFKKKEKKTP
jgi:phospholipid/cholesterol/gamma-HCH transport system substrate-binding protein